LHDVTFDRTSIVLLSLALFVKTLAETCPNVKQAQIENLFPEAEKCAELLRNTTTSEQQALTSEQKTTLACQRFDDPIFEHAMAHLAFLGGSPDRLTALRAECKQENVEPSARRIALKRAQAQAKIDAALSVIKTTQFSTIKNVDVPAIFDKLNAAYARLPDGIMSHYAFRYEVHIKTLNCCELKDIPTRRALYGMLKQTGGGDAPLLCAAARTDVPNTAGAGNVLREQAAESADTKVNGQGDAQEAEGANRTAQSAASTQEWRPRWRQHATRAVAGVVILSQLS
jgi:hypothetical protein